MTRTEETTGKPTSGKVLLVSDDPEAAGFWVYGLRQLELVPALAGSAAEALDRSARDTFDLVVIDARGPRLDGIELTRHLRKRIANPILFFTPNRDEQHALDAYQAGIDECVVTPVSPSLFLAKVRAWLRRSRSIPAKALTTLNCGTLRLDPERQELLRDDASVVPLTNLEFRVLYLLMSRDGEVLPVDLIVERVWGSAGYADAALVKNVVYRLRRKVEPDPAHPCYLHTVGRQGYLFSST
jgi:DNA-binding response OmpR family regulator